MKLTFSLPGLLFIPTQGKIRDSVQAFREKSVSLLMAHIKTLPPAAQVWLPIDWYLQCQALFYRGHAGGIATLYYHTLAEILTEARLIAHEKWIQSWDGSRLLIDRENPRVEFVIHRLTKKSRTIL